MRHKEQNAYCHRSEEVRTIIYPALKLLVEMALGRCRASHRRLPRRRLALGSPLAEPNPRSTQATGDQNGQRRTHSIYEGYTLSESRRAAIDRSDAEALFPRLRGGLS
jgi:hypothetical protein